MSSIKSLYNFYLSFPEKTLVQRVFHLTGSDCTIDMRDKHPDGSPVLYGVIRNASESRTLILHPTIG